MRLPRFWGDRRSCPPGWVLGQAASRGPDAELGAHLATCVRCTAELRSLDRLSQRAQELKGATIPPSSRERILMALRSEASGPRHPAALRRTSRWLAATALIVLAGSGGLLLALRPRWRATVDGEPATTASGSHALVRVVGAARYTRSAFTADQVIRLEDGMLELDVRPLATGQRLRVLTADAEVEVRGTQFSVSASGDRLLAVRVFHGSVEVRAAGGRVALLNEGDQWVAARPAAMVAGDAGPPVEPVPLPAIRPTAKPPAHGPRRTASSDAPPASAGVGRDSAGASTHRAAFDQGWQLLRGGDLMGASRAFAALEEGAPGDAIVEDALFWRGVALSRAGEKLEARTVFGSFLARFPRSPRIPEASVLQGWLLVDAGDRTGARALFERAARDRSDRIRASARSGLQQLEALEEKPEKAPAPPTTR